MFFNRSLVLALLLLYFTCGFSQDLITRRFPGTPQGAYDLLNYILQIPDTERKQITRELKPTLADCETIFEGNLGKKVYRYQQKLDRQADIVIRPLLQSQTDLLLWHATTSELLEYSGEAQYFPGGYKELAQFMDSRFTFYRFKFIQPGRYLGSAYDILIHVNGRWRVIHRPWTVLIGQR
ncbi:MAG: hypothetical protein SF052_01605 [Bacteroidia bacterium]|nr:hypothetical protein [Bacteroidia bacterium]